MSVIIVGGGMTGTILALALSRLTFGQLPVHLVEKMAPDTSPHPSFDTRAVAISQGTCQQLTKIDIWEALSEEATEIKTIHVSEQGHFGFFTLRGKDYNLYSLGKVIELHNIGKHLVHLLKKAPGVTFHCPAIITAFTRSEKEVNVTLNNSNCQLIGQLIVGADGSQSFVRTTCDIPSYQKSYHQAAIIANVLTSIAHNGCAFERFTENGSLAMLPLSKGRSALVWCNPQDKINEVMAWSDDHFCNELQKVFGWRLGRIIYAGKRSCYSLVQISTMRSISHRVVLIGNAAQTLHPIAGQGFNLALHDIISLAEILAKAWVEQRECGSWEILCNYQLRRKVHKETTINLTNNLLQLFKSRWVPHIIGRNAALLAIELFSPVRKTLIQNSLNFVRQ